MSYYGQHLEDLIIEEILNDDKSNGVCIEVGAYDGRTISNTLHFEEKGWTALCIEPIPSAYEECTKIRKQCYQCCISDDDYDDKDFTIFCLNTNLCAISSLLPDERLIASHAHLITDVQKCKVKVRSLNSLLKELDFPKDIDFISIDTENTELDVLKGIDLNIYNVKLFVIENNFDEPFIENYLSQFSYTKVKRVNVNDFYIKSKN
jgi:FkbM family methyltransferase